MTTEIKQLDRSVGILLAALCGVTIGIVTFVLMYPVRLTGYDFEAFWCGARTLLMHANPYLNEPLQTCEATTLPAFFVHYPQVTIPVPLPAYAIALFVPFALLPFTVSRALWWLLQLVCTFGIARGITSLSGMPPITALAASALAVLAPSVLQGALAPIPIALTVGAALALQRRSWTVSAILLGFAMIEPHMALPACAAVWLFVPQMRLRLTIAGACAASVMLAAVGPHVALSYLTTVLPLHAASEVNNAGQESLTALLYQLGVPLKLSLQLGFLQYALLGVAGIVLARALYKKYADLSWLILLPAAFAVIGGGFIHLDEVAMALPLACLIAMRRPGLASFLVLFMLALPVESIVDWIPWAIPAVMVCLWFISRPGCTLKRFLANGILPISIAGSLVVGILLLHQVVASNAQQATMHTVFFAQPGNNASASVTWAAYNALARRTILWWPEKVWTLLPLLALIALCVREAFEKKGDPISRHDSHWTLSPTPAGANSVL